MVDNVDPKNQTSVEYGESLLKRKVKQDEKFAKAVQKDSNINYAFQVLGGVDTLIKDRYERNVADRNAGFDQDIIRETAEFNRLQKIYDEQAEYRNAISPYGLAQQKANAELVSKFGSIDGIKNLPLDNQTRIDFDKAQKELANFHYDKYINNKITMPYDTAEEYTAELQALKNKRVPAGLLDSVLRVTGLRKKDARSALDLEMSTTRTSYADKLAERKGVKGSVDNLTDEMKAAYLGAPSPSPDITTEEFVKIPNGRGEDISLIAVTTTDALGNTEITGARSATGEVIPMSQFIGVTKKQAQESLIEATTKILLMEGNKDLTPRGVQKYIYDNPKEFPNLAVHMKVHGLHLPRIKAFDSKDTKQLESLSAGLVGNLQKDPVYGEYYDAMNGDQVQSLQGGILQSIEWYNDYGIKGRDGQIVYLESADILKIAQAEQLQGLKYPNIKDYTGDALVTYEMVQPGSLSTSIKDKSDAFFVEKEDGSFESTAPKNGKTPPQFENLQPEENDTADTLKSKGTHIINKLVASPEFDNASFAERRSYVEKIEEKYGTEFDVPYNLLNPSATPMVEEVDISEPSTPTIAEQVENLRTDGTEKDPTGFLGPIKNNVTGGIMSEVSMGIGPEYNQKLIPLLVPTLTQKEIETLQNMELEGNVASIPQSIKDKAVRHAQEREEKGLSPFYGGGNLGERPEGVQLELTDDASFDSVRTADEMLQANQGPSMLEGLQPAARPEFKELTREEKIQQSQEERERANIERARRSSPEGRKERKEAREKKEAKIKKSLYDTFIDPDRFDIKRIQQYADGRLSKNRKRGSTKGTLGKTLKKYGLENMSIPEIKKWLATKDIKTAYSPSDIQAELNEGKPVFVGDYRNVKNK